VRARVAVVGAGVAGLTAAYLLQRRFDVTLYEAADRLGGHAHTHDVVTPDAGTIPVDSGFIVYNDSTYPHFRKLLGELGVATQATDMSMSIRCDGCGLEYCGGRGLGGVLAQPRSVITPAFVRMLGEVRKFYRQAKLAITRGDDGLTLRSFLVLGGYSKYFVRHFVVPVVSCVWSAGAGVALDYPARYLFIFLDNHGMLSVAGSPEWRTINGGSRVYVERLAKGLHAVRTTTPVRAMSRTPGGVEIHDDCDEVALFDRTVVATHADAALRLLAHPTHDERALLGIFEYSRNETFLHTDQSLLPRAARARSSWNYLLPACDADTDGVLVSYDMNRLQSLPSRSPCLVTLNATERIDPGLVIERMTYEHPIYTLASVAAQQHLADLNDGTIAFAGAYHGWGFHEDGCRSGVAAAASLGAIW
jgi:predicted NAD/FAD-binding protein